ncbi:hypothetical protein DF16_pBMB400orf00134 (plasmid) [Bacillus thuringiensis serovar kurstaki str. YBT-1520]|nr:hypothetical protein DF16_pBMB400orf00134 [Bacillus thuringiensis serovar kurstaki str. YBT-1520]
MSRPLLLIVVRTAAPTRRISEKIILKQNLFIKEHKLVYNKNKRSFV